MLLLYHANSVALEGSVRQVGVRRSLADRARVLWCVSTYAQRDASRSEFWAHTGVSKAYQHLH